MSADETRVREIARGEVTRHQAECPFAGTVERLRESLTVELHKQHVDQLDRLTALAQQLAGEEAYGQTHAERLAALEAALGKSAWVAIGALISAVLALLSVIGGLVVLYLQVQGGP